jgi:holliday junction DNA helicase RuvA
MIGRLRGTLVERGSAGVVVEVAGVGYEVAMPSGDVARLPTVGEEVVVHTHLHVREDQHALFGFASEDARDLFRHLIAGPGVGPKLALAVLTTLTPDQVRAAVHGDDAATLATVPGIGARTAQKLLLDLRARLDVVADPGAGAAGVIPDVRAALEGLGYTTAEIRDALDGLDPAGGVEEMLRAALRRAGRR